MKVVTEIMVSGFLLQRSLAGFLNRNSERKEKTKTKKQKTAKAYTNTSDGAQKRLISILIILFQSNI